MALTLRNRFSRGSRLYYLSSTSVTQKIIEGEQVLGSQTAGWKVEIHQRVLDVEEDGSGHLLYRILPVSLSPEAMAAGISLHKQVAYMLVDVRGGVLEKSEINPVVPCSFPEGPVEVGQSWEVESEVTFPFLKEPVKYHNLHTLEGIDDVDGVSCARIAVHANSSDLRGTLFGTDETVGIHIQNEGALWFDHEDGTLVRFRMTTQAAPLIRGLRYDTMTTVAQQLIEAPSPVPVP